MCAKLLYGSPVGRLGQHPGAYRRHCEVVRDCLLFGAIHRTPAGHNGRDLFIGQPLAFGHDFMCVKPIGALKQVPVARIAISRTAAGTEGLNAIALVRSQIGSPNLGWCSQGFHGPSIAHVRKALKASGLSPPSCPRPATSALLSGYRAAGRQTLLALPVWRAAVLSSRFSMFYSRAYGFIPCREWKAASKAFSEAIRYEELHRSA